MRALATIAVVAAVAAVAWGVSRSALPTAPSPSEIAPSISASVSAPAPPAAAAATLVAPDGESTVAGTARSAAVPTTIEIRGRCVDDGGRPRSAGLELVGTELRGATDEFGVFALQVAVGAVPRRPVLACSAAGCATMEIALAEFAGPTLDDGIDIGEVRLSAGVDLPLRVVDGAGRAAAGCALELCRTVAGDETAIHARTRLPLTTDTTGAAVAPGVLVGGTWQVRSRSALVAVVAPREPFRLPFDLPCATLDVRIERPDPGDLIVGTVVTADDAAVANATVFALDEEERVVAEAVTDDSGTFALARAGAAPSDVRLAVPDVDGFERYLDLRPRPWGVGGGGGTWLRLRRAGELRLEVFAADTGLPIEAYSYRWSIPAAGIAGPRGAFAPVAAHPGGVALVGGVPAGGAEVEVVPDPAGAYARSLPVALPAGQRALTVFVPPRRPLVVRVVDDSGLPIGGSRVTVSRAGRELAAATTSSAGSATLAPGDPRSGVLVTVRGDHVPVEQQLASDVEELDLVASAGGRVVGRVVPAAAIAAFRAAAGGAEQLGLGPRLRLRSTAAAPQVPVPSVEVASDGVFEFAHVPAGEWVLEFDAHTTDVGRAPTRHIAPPLHVRVASTRTEAVEVAIGGIAPADVWAPVLRINGEPAARCELRLQASGLDRDSSAPETVQTDERGVLALRGLRPGRYRLDEAAGGAGGGTVAFDLEPGERRLAALWLSSSR